MSLLIFSCFFQVFYQYLLDDDEEVRTNACFGMGVLCMVANQQLLAQYETILSRLSQVLSKETNLRMIDNISSCLCRMIVVSPRHVPLEQVMFHISSILKEEAFLIVTAYITAEPE